VSPCDNVAQSRGAFNARRGLFAVTSSLTVKTKPRHDNLDEIL
jgi:hypothetical protein